MRNKKTNYFIMALATLFISSINIHSLDIKADNDYQNTTKISTHIETKYDSIVSNNKINKVTNVSSTLSETIVYSTLKDTSKTSDIEIHRVENDATVKKSKTSVSNSPSSQTNKEITSLNSEMFTLTFYTSLAEENSGYEGLNAYGGNLQYGQVASNVYPEGTQIRLDGMGTFEVKDTGGQDFNSDNRLDVFIPRLNGESDSDYKDRVLALGRVEVRGYILN